MVNKGGRPKLKIDPAEVRKYAGFGATTREIAAMLHCDESVIRRRFDGDVERARAERRVRIRQAQNKLAADGNPAMLIWLGKNELGQTDRQDVTTGGQPLYKVLKGVSQDEL